MKKYLTSEISFDVPDEWIQSSINIFPNLKVFGKDFSLVITRDKVEKDQALDAYVDEQNSKQLEMLPDFKIIKRKNIKVSDVTACGVHFQWKDNNGLKIQYQVYIPLPNNSYIILTGTTVEDFSSSHEEVFNTILSTLIFNKGKE